VALVLVVCLLLARRRTRALMCFVAVDNILLSISNISHTPKSSHRSLYPSHPNQGIIPTNSNTQKRPLPIIPPAIQPFQHTAPQSPGSMNIVAVIKQTYVPDPTLPLAYALDPPPSVPQHPPFVLLVH
jgi:hypothetical protein